MPSKKDAQLTTPTPSSLKEAFDRECSRLKFTDIRFRGRVVYPGHIMNGLIARFVSLPEAERTRVAREAVAEFEANWASGAVAAPSVEARLRGAVAVNHPARESGTDSPDSPQRAILRQTTSQIKQNRLTGRGPSK